MPRSREILLPWDRQPQEAADVDWSNPLTNGLVFLAPLRYGQLDDIVGGKRATVTGTLGSVATSDGVFPLFSGTQYIDYGAFGAEFPAGPATVAWIQTPIAQSGFSTPMNFKPSGGVNSFLVYQNGGGGSYAFTFGRNTGTGAANYNTTVGAPTNGNTRRFLLRSPSLDTATYTDYSLFDGLSGALAPDGATPYGGSAATGMRVGAVLSSAGDKFDGAIGMLAIWRRELSDMEARSYNSNPWQLFAPQTIWVPVSAGGGSISATLTQTLADATVSSASTLALKGAVSQTLADATTTATGALALKGTTTQTLADATLAATGTLAITTSGVLAVTLADATVTSTGTVALKAAVTQTLAAATLSATGKVATAGALAKTLADADLVSTGALAIKATASQTLADATLVASGVLAVTGSGVLAQTLADAAVLAAGKVDLKAVVSKTLADTTLTSTGVLPIAGIAAQTLADATLSAQGTAQTVTTGSVTATLDNATVVAAAKLAIAAYSASTLADAALVSTATMPLAGLSGAVTQTLESATCAASATVLIKGSAAITLGDCTIVASNVPTIFTDSEWWKYEVQVQDMRYSVPANPLTFEIER